MKTLENQHNPSITSSNRAGFGRRLGASLYDSLLVVAITMVAAVPFIWIAGDTSHHPWVRLAFQFYLLVLIFFYYGWFWVRSGQTLGLLTWKLRLIGLAEEKISWRQALLRFAMAIISLLCFGLGFLWALFDREKLAWHDRVSRTRLIHLR
jgi:uncharacterized RDD family membrane protein YckC